MNRLILLMLLLPNLMFCQEQTIAGTNSGDVKIPGKWEQLNTASDSGQTFFKNDAGVVIAIAQNPKKAYPFYNDKKSPFENVTLFYVWDSDFMKQNNHQTAKIKENAKAQSIIWKYNDGKRDNVYLFGSVKDSFINLLVYTDQWSEKEKIDFLENVYKINK